MTAAAARATKLAIVCTPIGNLADLTPRAADVLKGADIVLCEDTRHSKPLLDRTGSRAQPVSCHAHNERERASLVIDALRQGKKVALVSDAGAPAISDPGGRIVEAVIEAGLEVEVFPGPSALTAALMGAGVDASRFCFLGFLPKSGKQRRELLDGAARTGFAVVVYEAPQRVLESLAEFGEVFGGRGVVVARELTKLHETFHRGVLGRAIDGAGATQGALTPAFVEKGEVVIVIASGEPARDPDVDVDALARDPALPPKERAKKIAKATGMSTKDAYALVRASGAGELDADASLARAAELLAQAAAAFVDADAAARRARGDPPAAISSSIARQELVPSDVPGADALMALLTRGPALRAPVETVDCARALLTAMSSLDALEDALGWSKERAPSS